MQNTQNREPPAWLCVCICKCLHARNTSNSIYRFYVLRLRLCVHGGRLSIKYEKRVTPHWQNRRKFILPGTQTVLLAQSRSSPFRFFSLLPCNRKTRCVLYMTNLAYIFICLNAWMYMCVFVVFPVSLLAKKECFHKKIEILFELTFT